MQLRTNTVLEWTSEDKINQVDDLLFYEAVNDN